VVPNAIHLTVPREQRALEDRLRQVTGGSNQHMLRLRKNVVFQRLLARLVAVAPGRWMLNGGLAEPGAQGTAARA
jgi:hypothetical protein